MSEKRINLIKQWRDETEPSVRLDLIRIGPDQIALVPFTPESAEVNLHFVDKPVEIKGYVLCNGNGCVLCSAGRSIAKRYLVPMYVPVVGRIGILPISPVNRPGSLRPQILPLLDGPSKVLFISKEDDYKFVVHHQEITPGMDDGAAAIKEFLGRMDRDEIEFASVFPKHGNRALASYPELAAMLKLKGVDLDGLD